MGEIFHIPKINNESKSPLKLMSIKQILNEFEISKSTLYRLTYIQKKLPYVKINRRVWYKTEDILNLIESNYHNE